MSRAARRPAKLVAVGTVLVLALLAGLASPAGAGRTLVIRGRGWGHGIGMSQYGAYGRALAGHSAREILLHYYTGAHLRRVALPRKIRVGLLQGRRRVAVTSLPRLSPSGRVRFKVAGAGWSIASGDADDAWRVEASSTGGMRLYRNGTQVRRRGRTVFGSLHRPLKLLYAPYGSLARVVDKRLSYAYGTMLFGTYAPLSASCGESYCLRLVLKLSMQKYLYGLGEVPASWPRASLAAQAVAGRTYAFKKISDSGQHREPCSCAVYDSTVDQAYIGDAKRTGSGEYWDDWKRAVDQTRGTVLMYERRPIYALYSSSSGGHTENNENVWGGAAIPYLRGVRDRFDSVPANPNYRWRKTMSWTAASTKLNAAFGIGSLRRISLVRPFGVSGRVTIAKPGGRGGVRLVGSSATVRVHGWSIRSTLGLNDTWFRIKIRRTYARSASVRRCGHQGSGGKGPIRKLALAPANVANGRAGFTGSCPSGT